MPLDSLDIIWFVHFPFYMYKNYVLGNSSFPGFIVFAQFLTVGRRNSYTWKPDLEDFYCLLSIILRDCVCQMETIIHFITQRFVTLLLLFSFCLLVIFRWVFVGMGVILLSWFIREHSKWFLRNQARVLNFAFIHFEHHQHIWACSGVRTCSICYCCWMVLFVLI